MIPVVLDHKFKPNKLAALWGNPCPCVSTFLWPCFMYIQESWGNIWIQFEYYSEWMRLKNYKLVEKFEIIEGKTATYPVFVELKYGCEQVWLTGPERPEMGAACGGFYLPSTDGKSSEISYWRKDKIRAKWKSLQARAGPPGGSLWPSRWRTTRNLY